MNYTNDVAWELPYEDKPELGKKQFLKGAMKRHKWISFMVVMLFILTIVDAVLMVQFYEVLKEL